MVSVRTHAIVEFLLSHEPVWCGVFRSGGRRSIWDAVRGMSHSTAAADTFARAQDDGAATCPFRMSKQKAVAASDNVKPFSAIPTPRGLPFVGTMFHLIRNGGAPMIHEYCDKRHKQLGPIYRERLGAVDAVFVADSKLIQQVYTNDDKYPQHLIPEPWLIYNKMTGIKRGLFFMEGPEWLERRMALNRVFLKGKVHDYSPAFNDVISDLMVRWADIQENCGSLVDLEKELYNWSIESLGVMLFGKRLGCVYTTGQIGIIHEFVRCVQQIFLESAKMTLIPPRLASALKLPVWMRFTKAVGRALELAREYVLENIEQCSSSAENDSDYPTGVLYQLLQEGDIGVDELIRIVVDLFLAAADTTSHATQWALYLLAKNPSFQEKMVNELRSVVPKGEDINVDHLAELQFPRAVIREALRLYPVAPFLTRILSKDLVLGNYEIPAGNLILMSAYTTGRDEKYFKDPQIFDPERWLRSKGSKEAKNTFACLPFGFGVRSCIGRRVADSQMQLLLLKTVEKFKLESMNEREVGIRMRMITTPSEKIKLKLIARDT